MKNKFVKQIPGKSHDEQIRIGEGLTFGKTHTGKAHDKVVDAKHDPKPQKRAQSFTERSQNGGAETTGGGIKK